MSTMAPEEVPVVSDEIPVALDSNAEKVVAEGVIVSHFQGGLTAIKVLDDMTAAPIPEGAATPAQTNALQKPTTSNSGATGDDLQGRNVVFSDESRGIVVAHRPPVLFVYRTASSEIDDLNKHEDGSVKILSSRMEVKIPPSAIEAIDDKNTAIDTMSMADLVETKAKDSKDSSKKEYARAVFSPIPQVKDIALINNPMLTGVTMFDAMAPIGRGQNMLFVGHDLKDMRKYTVDFLANQIQTNPRVKCVYAAIDDKEEVSQLLEGQGIANMVQIVSPQTHPDKVDEMSYAAEAVATASTACAIAESRALRDGDHTFVVVDTIDWHKKLWDGTTRVLVDVFGVDAVVRGDREGGASSEMRAFFSTLVQRSAQYNAKKGSGSVTLLLLTKIPPMSDAGDSVFQEADFEGANEKVKARIQMLINKKIPLSAENLRKINIPIPSASEGQRRLVLQHVDDLISMSDGQIWLDEKLEIAGQFPPMDPQRSVTRVGIGADTESRADAPALRRIVEGMRLTLSQAADMSGAEATTASQKQLRRQKAYLLAMHQTSGTGGRRLSESCAALLAAQEGLLDDAVDAGALAGSEKGNSTMQDLLHHLNKSIPEQMREIDETLDLTEENKKILSETIQTFMKL